MTPVCFLDYKLSLPNCGTDYVCSHTRVSDSLVGIWCTFRCHKSARQSSPCLLPCLDCITVDDIWKCACTPRPIYCCYPQFWLVLWYLLHFCSRKSLGFLHVNTRSLLPKIDQLKVWVHSSSPDVLVITETWLRKCLAYWLSGYNLFWQDRSSKGGEVAIFTKDHFQCSVVSTKSFPKQFDLLVLSIKLSNSSLLAVAGCYRPPSAPACTLPALRSLLAGICPARWPKLGHA